jgi:chemotaxis signal transduction protein
MTAAASSGHESRFVSSPVLPVDTVPRPAPEASCALEAAPAPERRGPRRPWRDMAAVAVAQAERPVVMDSDGYVVFAIGATRFAVAVSQVREIIRAVRLDLLPDQRHDLGRGVALVDARGRSIPVVDLRTDTSVRGDVLLPLYRHHVGLVVDRVVAVQTPLELLVEDDHLPVALPSYSRGVLRPAEGGVPVLLIELPDAAEIAADAVRDVESRLGSDVLGSLPDAI